MKIGFFTDYYLPEINGVSISVDLFRKALEKRGHTVYVFCPKYPKPPKNEPATIVRFNSTPGIWYEGYRDTFPWTTKNIRHIKSLNLDVIHIHTGAQIGILGLRISKEENIPNVQTYHTDIVRYSAVYKRLPFASAALLLIGKMNIKNAISYREMLRIFKPDQNKQIVYNQKIIKDMVKIFCNLNDLVVVPSEKVEKMLESYGVEKPISIIPTGLDTDEIENLKPIPQSLAEKLRSSGPIILAVGRLGAEKNFQLIIKTLPKLINKYPNIRLVLAGGGPYEDELRAITRERNLAEHVIFTGWLEHSTVLDVYGYADVFVFPSQTDTQGLVLNEAAYFGLPIVYGDELISEVARDGVNGCHAAATTIAMAANIDKILADEKLRNKFSTQSKKLAKNLVIDLQVQKLEKAYQKLLQK